MRQIIRFFRRIRSGGIPLWSDRGTIAKEGRRLIDEGPVRYREADRTSRITVIVIGVMTVAIIALIAI
jgi:hypothetical protein